MPLEAANDNQIQNTPSQSNWGEIITDWEGELDVPVVEQVESTVSWLAQLFPGIFLWPNELVFFLAKKREPTKAVTANDNIALWKKTA